MLSLQLPILNWVLEFIFLLNKKYSSICCKNPFFCFLDILNPSFFNKFICFKIIDCYAKYGNIVGHSTLTVGGSSVIPLYIKINGPQLYIIDSFTKDKLHAISSIDITTASKKIVYIKNNKKINLLEHPDFIATK